MSDRSGLRVALIGKGGVGKSTIAGSLCRILARRGHPVLALDVDTVPGLALSLGAGACEPRLPEGLAEIVETKRGRRWKILPGAGPASLVDRYAAIGPDGVRLLVLGKLPHGVTPAVTATFRHVMTRFRRPGWAVVADLAAGTRQPVFGWADFARIRVLVTDPSAKSILTARRLTRVGTHLVVSRVREGDDATRIADTVGLPLLAAIPYDEDVLGAEQRRVAPVDAAPRAPAVEAIAELARQLEDLA